MADNWVRPIDYIDAAIAWIDEPFAYDGDMYYDAKCMYADNILEFILAEAIYCDKIRVYQTNNGPPPWDLAYSVYYNDAYHLIGNTGEVDYYKEFPLSSPQIVTKARVYSPYTSLGLADIQFNSTGIATPLVNGGLVNAGLINRGLVI